MVSTSHQLSAIQKKVEAAERLTFEDGLALEESNDLFTIGSMANLVRDATTAISRTTTSTPTSTQPTSAFTPATFARSGPTWARTGRT